MKKQVIDGKTGESTQIEMTLEEIAQYEADMANSDISGSIQE